jgi:hypothetical protein
MPAKKTASPKKEKIEAGSDKWEKCIEWIMSGKDVESLRKWYDITKEIEDALLKDANARGEKAVKTSQTGTTKTE